jgi:TRAP-type C4-dicarboxylate transport system permease small subunit
MAAPYRLVLNLPGTIKQESILSFDRITSLTTRVSRAIALIGLAGLLVLALATVLDVLLRWIFNSPIVGLNDTYSLFAAVIIASSFPLCIAQRGNITIRFLGKFLGSRVSNLFETFGNFVTCGIFVLMAWQIWLYANQLLEDGETTWILNWPVSPWWRVITILILVNVPVTLVMGIASFREVIKRSRPWTRSQ